MEAISDDNHMQKRLFGGVVRHHGVDIGYSESVDEAGGPVHTGEDENDKSDAPGSSDGDSCSESSESGDD